MPPSTAEATLQLALFDTPVWQMPDFRRDRDNHAARIFRDICYLDACGECFATSAWFAEQLGVVESTVKRIRAELEACGMIASEIKHGNKRIIRPLVTLTDAVRGGWQALCKAVLDRDKLPKGVRQIAAKNLRRSVLNLAKLGLSRDKRELPSSPRELPKSPRTGARSADKCTPIAPLIAPPLPIKTEEHKATTETSATTKAEGGVGDQGSLVAPQIDPVAVALLQKTAGIPLAEAQNLARGIQKDGGSIEQLRQAVSVALTTTPRNLAGFIRAAVRAAVNGTPFLKPAPGTAKEEKERVMRLVEAPDAYLVVSRAQEAQKATAGAWEALEEREREKLIAAARVELLTETKAGPLRQKIESGQGMGQGLIVARAKKLLQEKANGETA